MSAVSEVNPLPLISMKNIHVKLNHRNILQNINFELYEQEIVSIIGPNGAGKSTLIQVLLKILRPTDGQLNYHKKLVLSYVPQKFNPSPTLPLRVCDLLDLEQCPAQLKQQIILETGIKTLLQSTIHLLSGGEKQRVLLAKALLRQPQVLVLDEPMQGLDIQAEAEMNDYICSLPQRYGCSIVIVSHDLQWVIQGTDRVICLNKHICCTGTPENVQHHPEYQAIFGKHRVYYQHSHQHCQHNDAVETCQEHQPYPHLHHHTHTEDITKC